MTDLRSLKMMRALGAVADERMRQHTKWGQQDHPDLPPGLVGADRLQVFRYLGIEMPEMAQAMQQGHAAAGEANWALIAVEELSEAIEAAWLGDEQALRTELVQSAAVLLAWISAIDRRTGVPS